MLDDLERKLLRVLSNYHSRHHHIPPERDLERMMGRKMPVINRGLSGLHEKGYLEWQSPWLDTIQIKEAWDRDVPAALKPIPKPSDTRYWTDH